LRTSYGPSRVKTLRRASTAPFFRPCHLIRLYSINSAVEVKGEVQDVGDSLALELPGSRDLGAKRGALILARRCGVDFSPTAV
jgi:hypothetical protein